MSSIVENSPVAIIEAAIRSYVELHAILVREHKEEFQSDIEAFLKEYNEYSPGMGDSSRIREFIFEKTGLLFCENGLLINESEDA